LEWIFLAIFSAALFGLITALEKRLIDHHLPNLGVYYASISFSLLIPAVIVFLATGGVPDEATNSSMGWAALSGGVWGVGLAMVFWGYKLEEASRASAIVHTFPVFVAIVAVLWLDETLIPGQWAAIIVIVLGAFVISIRMSDGRGILKFSRAFPILIFASLLTALSHVFAKEAMNNDLTVWMTYALRAGAMAVAFAVIAKPKAFIEMFVVLRNWRTLALMLIADFLLAPVASISLTRATGLGAISLVAALAATRPFFVFMVSSFFSIERIQLLREPLQRDTLALKLVALAMIVGGIAILSLL
jgi:drug/metabolite transporter (DMT)-like permease